MSKDKTEEVKDLITHTIASLDLALGELENDYLPLEDVNDALNNLHRIVFTLGAMSSEFSLEAPDQDDSSDKCCDEDCQDFDECEVNESCCPQVTKRNEKTTKTATKPSFHNVRDAFGRFTSK